MADSIGLDIVEIARIERSLERFGERFLKRILGPEERIVYDRRVDRHQFLAGRLACKEAIVKALGKYVKDRPSLASLQIVADVDGRPAVSFPSELVELLARLDCLVSISHEKNYAVAIAIFSEKRSES